MRTYKHINTRVTDTSRLDKDQVVYDVTVDTQGFKVYGLTDLEYARLLSLLKVCEQKRYKEDNK